MSDTDLNTVSVTQGDRVLTGVGADPDKLAETMERHAPEAAEPPKETTAAPAESQQPKESRGSKRIAQITKEREEERERREAVEKERDDLRARLAATAPSSAAGARDDARTPASDQSRRPSDGGPDRSGDREPTRAKPTEAQVGSKYETYADFVEDLADWKAEQRLAALDLDARISKSIEGDRASRTQQDHVAKAMERGRKAYADFDAVLNSPHAMASNWPGDKIQVIASLEEPEHIQYALAKDPALAERLRTEPNLAKFGMELAKLIPAPAVARLASTAGAGTVTPPPPFQPVGAGSKTTAPPLADLPKRGGFDYDKSGYREARAAQLGRGGTRRR